MTKLLLCEWNPTPHRHQSASAFRVTVEHQQGITKLLFCKWNPTPHRHQSANTIQITLEQWNNKAVTPHMESVTARAPISQRLWHYFQTTKRNNRAATTVAVSLPRGNDTARAPISQHLSHHSQTTTRDSCFSPNGIRHHFLGGEGQQT